MRQAKPSPSKLSINRLTRCVNIASELAGLLVQIRGRPRVIDVLAIAAKGLDISLRIREELVVVTSHNPWEHFGLNKGSSSWAMVPSLFLPVLMSRVGKRKQATRGFEEKAACAWEGEVQGIRVGWIALGEQVDVAFVARDQVEQLEELIRAAVWALIPSGHAVLKDGGLVQDELEPTCVVRTDLVANTFELVEAFLKAGEHQSYLIVGDPGTGKTTAIQHVARALNLRSLRIPLGKLTEYRNQAGPVPQGVGERWTIGALVTVTRPDILIIDDIDRADSRTQNELLEFVDVAKRLTRAFIASANDIRHVIPPLRRPERFDEHITVPSLSMLELEKILGELEKDVALQMEGWPIAYVTYYLKLVRVRGREKARSAIPSLQRRIIDANDVPELPMTGHYDGGLAVAVR
jgi:hypothetical protein